MLQGWFTVPFSVFRFSVFPTSGYVVKKRQIEKDSIQTDPWWLHNGGSGMQALLGALETHFFLFPSFCHPQVGKKAEKGKNGKNKKNLRPLHFAPTP